MLLSREWNQSQASTPQMIEYLQYFVLPVVLHAASRSRYAYNNTAHQSWRSLLSFMGHHLTQGGYHIIERPSDECNAAGLPHGG